MFEFIVAQTTPIAPPSITITSLFAAVGALLGAARIFYVLTGDLGHNQAVLSDPLTFAVKNGAGFSDIQAEKWKGMRALILAQQLDHLMQRFGLLLRTQGGCSVCAIFVAFFLVAFVYASNVPGAEPAQDFLLKAAGLLALIWTVLIERCKALKKEIELLQVK